MYTHYKVTIGKKQMLMEYHRPEDFSYLLAEKFRPTEFLVTFDFKTASLALICIKPDQAVFSTHITEITELITLAESGVKLLSGK